jgi:hypothetical protein
MISKEKLNSRKLLATAVIVAIATGLILHGDITADHWVDVLKWVVGAYLASQGWVDAKK